MSSVTSATKVVNAAKNIIESFTSSSEKDHMTTTYTDHTQYNDQGGIMATVQSIISHPKFKWALLFVLLCVTVYIYFRKQSKRTQSKTEKVSNTLVDQINQQDLSNIEAEMRRVLEHEIRTRLQNELHAPPAQPSMKSSAQPSMKSPAQPSMKSSAQPSTKSSGRQVRPSAKSSVKSSTAQDDTMPTVSHDVLVSTESDSSSEEVFIEDKNIMNHNLTQDEINAIDKQLEDGGIDHINASE